MALHHQNPSSLLDAAALYCQENHWDDDANDNQETEHLCFDHQEEEDQQHLRLTDQDFVWEDEELSSLFSKEELNFSIQNFEHNPFLAESRRIAVDWMLRVVGHYSFSAQTAVLAVNYLDRFMFSFDLQRDKPWMVQLVAVSCLSIAAKMEETQVPLLVDLQVEDTQYVFEANTIQRMEVLVLSTLKWKMSPVTPLSFLDYITRRLGITNYLCWEFLNRCDCLLLSIIADCRFMKYLPSVIATATMLLVINDIQPCVGAECQTQLLSILGIDKSKLEDCCKLIQELTAGGFGRNINKRKFGSLPGSPKGVMDLSFSSDCSNDSWSVAGSSTTASVSSSPEPVSKKSRAHDNAAGSDIFSIPP